MKRLFPFIYVFSCLIAAQSFAGSATWNLNASRVWNSASNWTPATVPNGPQDTATFGVSQQTFISQLLSFELNGFVFNPGASAYTILLQGAGLNLDGTGIINNSGVTQNVSCNVVRDGDYGGVYFYNSATSGESVNYDLEGGPKNDFIGANVEFHDQSSAGSSVFTTHGGQVVGASGSSLYFYDESSAAHATFINNGGSTSF